MRSLVISAPTTHKHKGSRPYRRYDPYCKGINAMYHVRGMSGRRGVTLVDFCTSISIPYATMRVRLAGWPIGTYREAFEAVVASVIERQRPCGDARAARRIHAKALYHSRLVRGEIHRGTPPVDGRRAQITTDCAAIGDPGRDSGGDPRG